MNVVVLAVVSFAIYANTLGGDFVYDDNRQILKNPLIQQSQLYSQALTSDVWAFKGDGTSASSNYWRPTFTALNIVEYAAFGANPFGWHLVNILLHCAVCIAAYFLLVILGLGRTTSLIIALIFAVHPVHSESVAWIAGSPDILFGLFILISFLLFDKWSKGRNLILFAGSVIFYLLALGSKEVALFCLPIYALILFSYEKGKWRNDRTLLSFILFLACALAYFLARLSIIGALVHPVDDPTGTKKGLLSIPETFFFYLKQIFIPITFGENYPLRPIAEIGIVNFIFPLIGMLLILALCIYAAFRDRLAAFGAALFFLPMIPVLFTGSFPSDQIVHDRYLYLPLLGMLILVYGASCVILRNKGDAVQKGLAAVSVVIVIALGIRTFIYNPVWKTDLSLWAHNVKIDPASAQSFINYGAELSDHKQYREAIAAYDQSLDIKLTSLALMGRARNYMAVKEFQKAAEDLRRVINMPDGDVNAYTLYQTYETYAILCQTQKQYAEAEILLRSARERLPIYYAALTEKLAIILYLQDKKPDAINELETARSRSRIEMLDGSKNVLLRLGLLYAESGNADQARADLNEYLNSTETLTSPNVLADRKQAQAALARLK